MHHSGSMKCGRLKLPKTTILSQQLMISKRHAAILSTKDVTLGQCLVGGNVTGGLPRKPSGVLPREPRQRYLHAHIQSIQTRYASGFPALCVPAPAAGASRWGHPGLRPQGRKLSELDGFCDSNNPLLTCSMFNSRVWLACVPFDVLQRLLLFCRGSPFGTLRGLAWSIGVVNTVFARFPFICAV